MKTLYLIRHAKSDQGNATLADIDRPLNTRGYTDAHKMSLILKEKGILPDLIITSPAIRAISTALIFASNLNFDPSDMIIESDLYDTNVKKYLRTINAVDNNYKRIMLFGHNPIITDCANSLINSFTESVPTCSIIGIKTKGAEWAVIADSSNELAYYDTPKNHL